MSRVLQPHPFAVSRPAYLRQLRTLVRMALAEDINGGDLTTGALRLGQASGHAAIFARQAAVVAGSDAVSEVFRQLDRRVRVIFRKSDGQQVRRGETVATLMGPASAILSGERTALNFLSRLSGIATTTHSLAAKIPRGTARLLDTRKTTPGWRLLEKYATSIGGARNHRMGLHDAVMIKDNHIAAGGGLSETLRRVGRRGDRRIVICEVTSLPQIDVALRAGITWLLLDNFTHGRLNRAVKHIRKFEKEHGRHIRVEASGNITARHIARVARTGVDFISVGAITHSAPAVDYSLEWITQKQGRSA